MNSLLQRNKFRIGCMLVLFVLAVCLFTLSLVESGGLHLLLLNKTSKTSVVFAFAFALMEGNTEVSQSLVVPEQRQKVVVWIKDQEPVSCLSFESEGWGVGDDWETIHIRESCLLGGYHCILIENIVFEQTTEGWQIQNWDYILEEDGASC